MMSKDGVLGVWWGEGLKERVKSVFGFERTVVAAAVEEKLGFMRKATNFLKEQSVSKRHISSCWGHVHHMEVLRGNTVHQKGVLAI